MACQREVIIIAQLTYVCALCADMCRKPGKREVPSLESFLSVGDLGLAPASPSFPTGFLEGDSQIQKQRERTYNHQECYLHYIHMGSSASFKSHFSGGHHSTIEQKHQDDKRTGANQNEQTSTIQSQTPVLEHWSKGADQRSPFCSLT